MSVFAAKAIRDDAPIARGSAESITPRAGPGASKEAANGPRPAGPAARTLSGILNVLIDAARGRYER